MPGGRLAYSQLEEDVTMRMEGSKRKRIVNTVFNEGAKNKAVCRA